jgi:microcystin-dependent protein
MVKTFEIINKYINFGTDSLRHTQGEADVDIYDIVGNRYYGDIDLTSLNWVARATHPMYDTLINDQLIASVDNEDSSKIRITWRVSAEYTAYPGMLQVQFVGRSASGTEIIKLQANDLKIDPSIEGTVTPGKNLFEKMVDTASNAAAESKADAGLAKAAQDAAANDADRAETAAEEASLAATSAATAATHAESSADTATASATAAAASALKAEQLAQGCKGWFVNVAALREAYPVGTDGVWAILGSTDSIWVWDSDTSNWINSYKSIDLSNYYTMEQCDTRFLSPSGNGAAITVPFTAPEVVPPLPTSPATLGALMTMLAAMHNKLAAIEDSMPGIGEWWFSPTILAYTGGVNSKAFARVNFNDDLSKTVYAALYSRIGDTLSEGAAEGFFNCKKLGERFPLAYGANFAVGSTGGEKGHTLTQAELPNISIVPQNGNRFVVLSDTGSEIWQSGTSGYPVRFDWGTKALGSGVAHNNMPPYLAQNIIIRAL